MGLGEIRTDNFIRAINEAGCVPRDDSYSENGKAPDLYLNFSPLLMAAHQRSIVLVGLENLIKAGRFGFDLITGTSTYPAPEMAMCLADRLQKAYFTRRPGLHGPIFRPGKSILIFDPASDTGREDLRIAEELEALGLRIAGIVTAVDKQNGARKLLEENGYPYHPLLSLDSFIKHE